MTCITLRKDEATCLQDILPSNDVALVERAKKVLLVLYKLRAFDSDHRKKTALIAHRPHGDVQTVEDANSYKHLVAWLAKVGYLKTKCGAGGGCWLTPSGMERARRLREP
jgi:hypothetical protein